MAQVSIDVEVTFQVQMLQKSLIGSFQKLIEDVEVSFVGILMNDPRFLQ